MPQLQHKALLQQEKRLNFQQTIDIVQKKFLGASPPSSAPGNGQHWAPISSHHQTLYNPIPKTSYLFDDIMTADGIIDLRFMNNTPGNNFYKPRLFSRQENVSSNLNLKSETSTGVLKPSQHMPKRLQNFYQFTNLENYPSSQQGMKPVQQESRRKSRNALVHIGSDSLSESQHTGGSSQNVTRQVVFFKTTAAGNSHNTRGETGGSYNMQYPHLRPRLNIEQGAGYIDNIGLSKSHSKGASSLTVQHHQKYIKTGAVTTTSFVQIPTTQASQTSLKLANGAAPLSPEIVLEPQPNLLRMSKDIEKSKIRESLQSFGLLKSHLLEDSNEKRGANESIKLLDSNDKLVTQINPVKHVIFSTYEGQVKGLQFAKNIRNLASKQIPPLYPSGISNPLQNMKSSTLAPEKQEVSVRRHQTPLAYSSAYPQDIGQGHMTGHSTYEHTANSLRSRGGTVSPKSRQAGQFFSNGGPGSLQLGLTTGNSHHQSPVKKASVHFFHLENGADNRVFSQAMSGSGTKRGEVLGSVRNTAGSNQSQRAQKSNKNYIKGLMKEGSGPTHGAMASQGQGMKKKNQISAHDRMDLSIAQSKFTNLQSV